MVIGNCGETVRCGEIGHDTWMDKVRTQNANATFTIRFLDVLCALVLKERKDRPSEVVSRTDGDDALDRRGDIVVSRSAILSSAGQICLVNMFDASFLQRVFSAD